MSTRVKLRWGGLALALLLLVPVVALGQGQPVVVGVDPVRTEPLQQTVPVIGRVVAREGGVIAARTAGPVLKMNVHVGDRIKAGGIIATLVSETIEARIRLQKADLDLAEQELRRLERLRASRSAAFPKARYDDALQKVARAKANLLIASLARKYSLIRAPFPGVVTQRHTDTGAYLKLGDPVVTLMNDRNVEIEADVPSNRVSGLAPGATVRFQLGVGPQHIARVRAVVPMENSLTRTRAVRFTIDRSGNPIGPNYAFAIGQSATLQIPIGRPRDVVSVHKDAIVYRGAATLVFVVIKGKALPRPVKLGEAVGARFVVLKGLKPGERVVVRGNERLRPGQKVRAQKAS